jgi:N6-adenosine-specific RNA methylase IME4/ParB-like chromosome segregation protein Spo0J
MAAKSKPRSGAAGAKKLPKTMMIALGGIAVLPDRMRESPKAVDELAESISRNGLQQPIIIRPRSRGGMGYELVAGLHRLKAVGKLNELNIRAEIHDLDDDEAKLVEIDENLIRADLTPAERVIHIARRKDLYEQEHPETKHGGDRKSSKVKSKSQNENLKAFVKDTAMKTRKGRSTVARDVTRANKVPVLKQIVGTSLDKGDEIDALAKLPEDEQSKLAGRDKAGEKVSAKLRVKQVRRAEREQRLGEKQIALPNKKYGVIVADSEWDDKVWSRETGMDRHPSNHYPTSDEKTIASRPVASIAAKDCVLFSWTTNQHLRIAIGVLEAWGFEYKSNYVWDKQQCGKGHWNRSRHEILLIGTRGNPPGPAPGEQWESIIGAPRPGEHSAKPECFLEMIEEYYPTMPKIELNRRGPARDGWDAWGFDVEAPPDDEAAE